MRITVEVLRDGNQVAKHVDLFRIVLAAAEQHFCKLFEPKHPERQVEASRIDFTLYSGNDAANSLCGSRMSTRRSGRATIALRRSRETAVDLPTPVVPTTAKCRDSVSSIAMFASISSSWESEPMV